MAQDRNRNQGSGNTHRPKKRKGTTSPGGTTAPSSTRRSTGGSGSGGSPTPDRPAPPAAPTPVAPYDTGADLQAFNDYITNFATSLEDIDNQLTSLTTDTKFQKTQNDKSAKENTSLGQDAMAARGLFQSSVKDAALYDIEATRALSNKFLDDKLTEATLNAGTRKKTLADSKKRFDDAHAIKMGENAAAINDPANASWADQMATYNATQPKPTPPKPAATFQARPGTNSRGEPGVWHVYPDGHKVFVRK